jgi:putative ATPase
MTDLFEHAMQQRMETEAPLAARLRPRTFEEFVGQQHIIGEGKLLRRAIQTDRLFSSIIFPAPAKRRSPSLSPTTPKRNSSASPPF